MKPSQLVVSICCVVGLTGCPAETELDSQSSSSSSGSSGSGMGPQGSTSLPGGETEGTESDTSGPPDTAGSLDLGSMPPDADCTAEFEFVWWGGEASLLLAEVEAASAFVGVGDCSVTTEVVKGRDASTLFELMCVMDGSRDEGAAFEQETVAFSVMLHGADGLLPTVEALGTEVSARLVVTPDAPRAEPDIGRDRIGNVWLVLETAGDEGLVPALMVTAADALQPPTELYAPYYEGGDWFHGPTVSTVESECTEADECRLPAALVFEFPGLVPQVVHPWRRGSAEGTDGLPSYMMFPVAAAEATGMPGCQMQVDNLSFVSFVHAEQIGK